MPEDHDPTVAGVVLAAGSGARFGTRKQFLPLRGSQRLVDRALASLRPVVDVLCVVVPDDHEWSGDADAVVVGGADRLASVRAALGILPSSIEIVVVSDAAHPLASTETAKATIGAVRAGADAALPWLEAVDVLKRLEPDGRLVTVGRDGIGAAQVPVAFRRAALDAAHRRADRDLDTPGWEDTQLIEADGGTVVTVPGDPGNIHVVDQASLVVARRLAR